MFTAVLPEVGQTEWLTIEQAIEFAQIGKSTLYKHLNVGTFKSVSLRRPGTIRGRRFVSRASILAHLEGLTPGEGLGYATITA
jgi:hypothetical protein